MSRWKCKRKQRIPACMEHQASPGQILWTCHMWVINFYFTKSYYFTIIGFLSHAAKLILTDKCVWLHLPNYNIIKSLLTYPFYRQGTEARIS